MDWDGNERRARPRDMTDLDFTWQSAFHSLRREFQEHFKSEADNATRITAIEKAMSELLNPERGRFTALEKNIEKILETKTEARGAIRLLVVLAAVASSAAAFWSWIATHVTFK